MLPSWATLWRSETKRNGVSGDPTARKKKRGPRTFHRVGSRDLSEEVSLELEEPSAIVEVRKKCRVEGVAVSVRVLILACGEKCQRS